MAGELHALAADCLNACDRCRSAREMQVVLVLLLVSGLLVAAGTFLPYRSGSLGWSYVDGTDDSRVFFGAFTCLLGIIIVTLAIIGLATTNRQHTPRAPRLSIAAGVAGLLALGLTLADLVAAQESNEAFGGQLGIGIVTVAIAAATVTVLGFVAAWRLERSQLAGK